MLLFIDACLREEESRTKELCEFFLAQYKKSNPQEELLRLTLARQSFAPLNRQALENRDALIASKDWDNPIFDAARLFARADKLLIGAPYWDFSFPSVLKCYIEHICVNGITLRYTEHGPEGLCRARRMCYIMTAGGMLPERESGFDYLRQLFGGLFGIEDCRAISAGMLDVVGQDVPAILHEAKEKIKIEASVF